MTTPPRIPGLPQVSEKQNNPLSEQANHPGLNTKSAQEICNSLAQKLKMAFMSIFCFVTVRRAICIPSDDAKCSSSWGSLRTALSGADIKMHGFNPVLQQIHFSIIFFFKNQQVIK